MFALVEERLCKHIVEMPNVMNNVDEDVRNTVVARLDFVHMSVWLS